MKPARSLLYAAVSMAVCLAPKLSMSCTLERLAILPAEIRDGEVVLTVGINGQAAHMVLDTGGISGMTEIAAKRFGLRANRTNVTFAGISGSTDVGQVTVSRLDLGSLQGHDVRFFTTPDFRWLTAQSADGLIGMNFLTHYDIDLDMPGHRVILYSGAHCSKPAVALSGNLFVLPLIGNADRLTPEMHVKLNGSMLRAILDTGSDTTTIFGAAAERAGFRVTKADVLSAVPVTGVGPHKTRSYRHVFERFEVGDITMNNTAMDVLTTRRSEAERASLGSRLVDDDNDTPDLLLGVDFLQKFHVWISNSSNTVVLQYPPAKSPVPDTE